MMTTGHPVIVPDAGPVGLAAAHLLERGVEPLLLEVANSVGASRRDWGHMRMFLRWVYNLGAAALRLLLPTGRDAPDRAGYPRGADWWPAAAPGLQRVGRSGVAEGRGA